MKLLLFFCSIFTSNSSLSCLKLCKISRSWLANIFEYEETKTLFKTYHRSSFIVQNFFQFVSQEGILLSDEFVVSRKEKLNISWQSQHDRQSHEGIRREYVIELVSSVTSSRDNRRLERTLGTVRAWVFWQKNFRPCAEICERRQWRSCERTVPWIVVKLRELGET